jgi:hypothetical protein
MKGAAFPIHSGTARSAGNKSELRALLGIFIEGLDRPASRFALAVVDLAQIQNRPLNHPTARAALALPQYSNSDALCVVGKRTAAQKRPPYAAASCTGVELACHGR